MVNKFEQLLNVYAPKYETGGRFWPIVHNSTIFSLVLMHIIAIGLFGLKEIPLAAGLTIPLPLLTLLFNEYCRKRFLPIFKSFPVEVCLHQLYQLNYSFYLDSKQFKLASIPALLYTDLIRSCLIRRNFGAHLTVLISFKNSKLSESSLAEMVKSGALLWEAPKCFQVHFKKRFYFILLTKTCVILTKVLMSKNTSQKHCQMDPSTSVVSHWLRVSSLYLCSVWQRKIKKTIVILQWMHFMIN